jgi:hypothetical protein
MSEFDDAAILYKELETRADGNAFVGKKVEAFIATGLPQSRYSRLFYLLTETGCIVQVQRGNSLVPTVITLVHPPDPAAIEGAYVKRKSLTTSTVPANIVQRVEAIEGRLPNIDLNSYIQSLDKRLEAIEARLDEGGNSGTE